MNLRLALATLLCVFSFGCGSCLAIPSLAFPCVRDAGVDAGECPDGWRCGLEDRCHPTGADAGAPYECQQDSDCEADWRCSVGGLCAESSNELLGAQYEGALKHQVLNPLLISAPPLLFSNAASRLPDGSPVNFYLTLLDGGVLDEATVVNPADGSPATRTDQLVPVGNATALAAFTTQAFLIVDGGVLFTRYDGGSGYFLPVDGARGLRNEPPFNRVVVLFGDAGYLNLGATLASAFPVSLPGACAGDPVLDVEVVQAQRVDDAGNVTTPRACLLASSGSGVFFANYGTDGGFLADGGADAGLIETAFPSWSPLPAGTFAPTQCGTSPPLTVTQLFPSQDGLGVALRDSSGNAYAALAGFASQGDLWDNCTPDVPCCGRLGSWAIAPCAVCSGQTLAEVRPTATSPLGTIEVHCVGPGPQSTWFNLGGKGNTCQNAFPLSGPPSIYFDRLVYNSANSNDLPYASAHGGLWFGSPGRLDDGPKTLSQRPSFLLEIDGGTLAFSGSQQLDATGTGESVQDAYAFGQNTGFVITGHNTAVQLAARVRGRGAWAVEENLTVKDFDAPAGYDFVSTTQAMVTPQSPYTATLVPPRDGGAELVLTSLDTIYSADVSAKLSGPPTPIPIKTGRRLVPAPGSAIVQATFEVADGGAVFAADGGARLLRGYLETDTGLFTLEAVDESEWHASPIPLSGVTIVSVWIDRGRGRIGLDDGTVLSLPGLVKLAGPVPESPPSVSAFGVLCHQAYALAARGLYRLMLDADGGTGHWQLEPLDAALAGDGDDFGLDSALIETVGSNLYVGTRYGGVALLQPAGSCE